MGKEETIRKAIDLYKGGQKTNVIFETTGIPRTTFYKVLKERGLLKKNAAKIHISLDEKSYEIMKKERPGNISRWICDKIKNQDEKLE